MEVHKTMQLTDYKRFLPALGVLFLCAALAACGSPGNGNKKEGGADARVDGGAGGGDKPGDGSGAVTCSDAGARKVNGQACACANDCESGFCVDGVCCNTAC